MDDISVMICDDSALMRNLIGRIVDETTGMTVCGKAENGQDLIEKLKTAKPDVILLDIEMPVMTGLQFLRKRQELHLDVLEHFRIVQFHGLSYLMVKASSRPSSVLTISSAASMAS